MILFTDSLTWSRCHKQTLVWLRWNKALWFAVESHMTSFDQSGCIIKLSIATLNSNDWIEIAHTRLVVLHIYSLWKLLWFDTIENKWKRGRGRSIKTGREDCASTACADHLKIAEKEAGDGPLKWWNISFPQAVILRFGQRGLRPDVQPTLNGINFNPTLIIFNPNKFKASMTILSRVYDWIETFLNER